MPDCSVGGGRREVLAKPFFESLNVIFLHFILLQLNFSFSVAYDYAYHTLPAPDRAITVNVEAGTHMSIPHGFQQDPFLVKAYVIPRSGPNAGLHYECCGSSARFVRGDKLFGIILGYNTTSVIVWMPWVGPSSFSRQNPSRTSSGLNTEPEIYSLTLDLWARPPPGRRPNFIYDQVVDVTVVPQLTVDHRLHSYPDLEIIKVMPLMSTDNKTLPFRNWQYPGRLSATYPTQLWTGYIYALSLDEVRIWFPSTSAGWTLPGTDGEPGNSVVQLCRVVIYYWAAALPPPLHQTDWIYLSSSAMNLDIMIPKSARSAEVRKFVRAVVRPFDGQNPFFWFPPSAMLIFSRDGSTIQETGLTVAHNHTMVRLILPKPNSVGRRLLLSLDRCWGSNATAQASDAVFVQVSVYSFPCNASDQIPISENACVNPRRSLYVWTVGSWTRCSNICGVGEHVRYVEGCSQQEWFPYLEADFESASHVFEPMPSEKHQLQWIIRDHTNLTTTAELGMETLGKRGVYLNASLTTEESTGLLLSFPIEPKEFCFLDFWFLMSGTNLGSLLCEVSTVDKEEDWAVVWQMHGDQGNAWWRTRLDLKSVPHAVKQLRFLFIAPLVCHGSCSTGLVALDNIKMTCLQLTQKHISIEQCRETSVPLTGCLISAVESTRRGPAYLQEIGSFVRAAGLLGDLVTEYEFFAAADGTYYVWMEVLARTNLTNGVFLSIDSTARREWHCGMMQDTAWRPTFIKFYLTAGSHILRLHSLETGFKFRHVAVVPLRLQAIAPLGMQSRYLSDLQLSSIPDSHELIGLARLNFRGGWNTHEDNPEHTHLQVTFPHLALVAKISIQGGMLQPSDGEGHSYDPCYVTRFALDYSLDDVTFIAFRDESFNRILFNGSHDHLTVKDVILPYTLPAKSIRILPMEHHRQNCLRFEVFGQYLLPELCGTHGYLPQPDLWSRCAGDRDCGPYRSCRIGKGGADVTEVCACDDGVDGRYCSQSACSSQPCLYAGTCVDLGNSSFRCHCVPPHYGNQCELRCPPGWYGPNCSQRCFPNTFGPGCTKNCSCPTNSTCSPVSGVCSCLPGLWGPLCDKPCRCPPPMACERLSGMCGCTPGYLGPNCSQTCPSGRFGQDCALLCSCDKNQFTGCIPSSGECLCPPGLRRPSCAEACSDGTFGLDCASSCICGPQSFSPCNKTTGTCTCRSGFTGDRCLDDCDAYRFGDQCRHTCTCPPLHSCNNRDGTCYITQDHQAHLFIWTTDRRPFPSMPDLTPLRLSMASVLVRVSSSLDIVDTVPESLNASRSNSLEHQRWDAYVRLIAITPAWDEHHNPLGDILFTMYLDSKPMNRSLLEKWINMSVDTLNAELLLLNMSVYVGPVTYDGHGGGSFLHKWWWLLSMLASLTAVLVTMTLLVRWLLCRRIPHFTKVASQLDLDRQGVELQPSAVRMNPSRRLVFENPYYDALLAFCESDVHNVFEEYLNPLSVAMESGLKRPLSLVLAGLQPPSSTATIYAEEKDSGFCSGNS